VAVNLFAAAEPDISQYQIVFMVTVDKSQGLPTSNGWARCGFNTLPKPWRLALPQCCSFMPAKLPTAQHSMLATQY